MILALRALGVGDLATAVPALRGLRAAFPDRPLALAAPAWLTPLVDLVGGVDRLIPTAGLANGLGVGGPPDRPYWAVNLHGRGPQSHRLLRTVDPARLVAYRCAAAGHQDGPDWTGDEHEVRRWCRLLGWYGVPADPADLGLRRPAPGGLPVAVTIVHPGGKGAERRWPAARFAALARDLTRLGHRVVVTGSATERALVENVVAEAGLPAGAAFAGRIDLAGLAGLVAHGRLLISTDTGIAHLATAYGTPSVVLFGPISPRHWGPPPDRPWHRALWATAAAWSGGPETGVHPALAAIGVEEVLDAGADVERAGRDRAVAAQ